MLSNGRTHWRSGGTLGSGLTVIDLDPLSGAATFTLKLDDGCNEMPEGFALEGWGQASHFRICARRVLDEDYCGLPRPYLRAFLGKYVLTHMANGGTQAQTQLYPILIIYESGILLVEFRMIGPDTVTPLAEFIEDYVNLFRHRFDIVEVTPGLSAFATRACYQSNYTGSIIDRIRLAWLQAGHDIAVREQTRTHKDSAFTFELAPLSGSEGNDLKEIALTVFYTVAFIVSSPKLGLSSFCRDSAVHLRSVSSGQVDRTFILFVFVISVIEYLKMRNVMGQILDG